MAFNSVGFEATVTFLDRGDNQTTMRFGVDGADISAAEVIMAANIADIVAVTKAYVVSYSIAEKFTNDAARTKSANGEIEEKATITVNLETAPKKAVIRIPAPVDTIFAGTDGELWNTVDGADSLLVAFLGDFASGGFQISDGEHVPATGFFVKGTRTHRSSSKG
jgi:hypothetical protein